jgi:hypothetical protein
MQGISSKRLPICLSDNNTGGEQTESYKQRAPKKPIGKIGWLKTTPEREHNERDCRKT